MLILVLLAGSIIGLIITSAALMALVLSLVGTDRAKPATVS